MIAVSLSTFSDDEIFTNVFFEPEHPWPNAYAHGTKGNLIYQLNKKLQVPLVNIAIKEKRNISILVPLQEQELISYTYIVYLENAGVQFTVSFVIESENQVDLFKRIPIIDNQISDLFNQFKLDNFEIQTMFSLPKFQELLHDFYESVNDLFLMESIGFNAPKNSYFMKLISDLGDAIHILLNSVVNNKKTVLIADRQTDQFLLSYPWSDLIPKPDLKIKFWPQTIPPQESFDILIIDKSQKKDCHSDWCIVDLKSGSVENGKSNALLKNYFTILKDLYEGLGNTITVLKLNPYVFTFYEIVLSNFVLFYDDSQEKEIFMVQSKI